jgi:uncharacterized protein YegP (UPF0339 family)
MKMLPYEVVKSKDGKPMIRIKKANGKDKLLSIEEIFAILIHKMKTNAEKMIG